MKDRIKQPLIFLFKYLIGFLLLLYILSRIDRGQMLESFTYLGLDVILLMLIFAVINLGTQFYRWKYLIKRHSSHYNAGDLIPSFFAGFAFRMMIPGGHAEISKVFLLPGKKSGKVMAFGIEKFFQTYIKLILVLIALPLIFPRYLMWFWTLAVLGILAYFALPYLMRLSFLSRFHERQNNHHRIFLMTLLYSLAIFMSLMLQYHLLLNDIHQIKFFHTALAVILIWGSGLIPISVSGLGVRENFAAIFLSKYGIPPYAAVGVALFIFVVNAIVPAVIGVFYIYKRSKDLSEAKGFFHKIRALIYERNKMAKASEELIEEVKQDDGLTDKMENVADKKE
ncbi:MAG: hypothetical protein GF313_15715 [Caldithrix sp.]|nr:hypothetical protein [Caldithrix sp.]